MNNKTLFRLITVFGLIFLLVAIFLTPAQQIQAQAPAAEGSITPLGNVGTAFSYQGQLTNVGVPISGTCDFKFDLWDDASIGSQIGALVEKTGVSLKDGNFNVELDFGANAFEGDARYLQISVRCPAGSGSYTDLSGRVALNAAPYALSLMPGAAVKGDTTGSILRITNTSNIGLGVMSRAVAASGKSPLTGAALWGDSASLPGVVGTSNSASGVFGWSSSNAGVGGVSDSGNGIQGNSTSGKGVYGEAAAMSGDTYGVYGKSNSPTGYGVYGTTAANNPTYAGVTGINTGGGVGSGVYGYSVGGYGVYARSTANKAFYADGDAHVEGELTWQTKTSFVSIATSAFIPEHYFNTGYVDHMNEGYRLKNLTTSGSGEWYTAPVQLPHGAIVSELRGCWKDFSDESSVLSLRRRSIMNVTEPFDTLTSVNSAGLDGSGREACWTDESISDAGVDNENYTYYLEVWLPNVSEDLELFGVRIKYDVSQPY